MKGLCEGDICVEVRGDICVEVRKEGQGTPFDPAGCRQGRGESLPRVHVLSRFLLI